MNILFVVLLIAFAVFTRMIPHQPNFSPLISIALFAGTYLKGWLKFIVPLTALFISDIVFGFYGALMLYVYGSLAMVAYLGFVIQDDVSITKVAGFSLIGSICFFIVTNLGVWMLSSPIIYPKTFTGFIECYIAAVPFFRNTLLSTLLYSAALFGIYELALKYVLHLWDVRKTQTL